MKTGHPILLAALALLFVTVPAVHAAHSHESAIGTQGGTIDVQCAVCAAGHVFDLYPSGDTILTPCATGTTPVFLTGDPDCDTRTVPAADSRAPPVTSV
jgi:hypothetical protein